MIETTGTITADDYLQAQRLHIRPRLRFLVIGLVVAALFVLALAHSAIAALRGSGSAVTPVLLILCFSYLALLYFVLLPLQARRIYRQQKTLHVAQTFLVDESGLGVRSELGVATLPWHMLHRWKENRHLFLVYHAPNLFTPLPKRLLSPEQVLSLQGVLVTHLRGAN